VHGELAALDGCCELGLQGHLFDDGLVHGGVEVAVAVLAFALGDVHGDVGLLQQLLGRRARRGGDADPDAGVGKQLPALDQQRLAEAVADAFGQLGGLPGVGQGLGEHGELVPAQPRHGVGGADQGGQPDRDRLQQPVADPVAGGVVDLLEVVQVHQQHPDAAAAARLAGQRLL